MEILDKMEQLMPFNVRNMDYSISYNISKMYYAAGDLNKFNKFAKEAERVALELVKDNPPSDLNSYYNPYRILLDLYEKSKEFDKAIDVIRLLQKFEPNDPGLNRQIEFYKSQMGSK